MYLTVLLLNRQLRTVISRILLCSLYLLLLSNSGMYIPRETWGKRTLSLWGVLPLSQGSRFSWQIYPTDQSVSSYSSNPSTPVSSPPPLTAGGPGGSSSGAGAWPPSGATPGTGPPQHNHTHPHATTPTSPHFAPTPSSASVAAPDRTIHMVSGSTLLCVGCSGFKPVCLAYTQRMLCSFTVSQEYLNWMPNKKVMFVSVHVLFLQLLDESQLIWYVAVISLSCKCCLILIYVDQL